MSKDWTNILLSISCVLAVLLVFQEAQLLNSIATYDLDLSASVRRYEPLQRVTLELLVNGSHINISNALHLLDKRIDEMRGRRKSVESGVGNTECDDAGLEDYDLLRPVLDSCVLVKQDKPVEVTAAVQKLVDKGGRGEVALELLDHVEHQLKIANEMWSLNFDAKNKPIFRGLFAKDAQAHCSEVAGQKAYFGKK